MNKLRWYVLVGLAAIVGLGGAAWFTHTANPPRAAPDLAIAALSTHDGDAGFAHAAQPHEFVFPRDHASHDNFRSEWWYFTGHLRDRAGRPFGFQLTLFRFALSAAQSPSPSRWRTPRVLLGHFALTDIKGRQFHAFERMSRAALGIAGVSATPATVWLDDWRIEQQSAHGWHLAAAQDGIEIELQLKAASAVVLQGQGGLSRKSAAAANASYYYSVPRLTAAGRVRLSDGNHAVAGQAWLDREWSTSALAREHAGWDWFAVQLADGGTLMFYRLRQRDGTSDVFSAGSYVDAHGIQQGLGAQDVRIDVLGRWHSAVSGREYPQGWRLRVARAGLDLSLTPRLADQEWRGRFPYWEGAVNVTQAGKAAGLGYVELTGYGQR